MKVSIITVVYNRHATILDAIKSVQSQSYQNIEHIIQDGGSTDGTLAVIKNNANENTKLESVPDGGIYDAINKAVKRSTGTIIGLMHSDDLFASPTAVEQIVSAFSGSQIDGTYSDLQYVSSQNVNKVIRYWRAGSFDKSNLSRGWMPPHPTLYLNAEIFDLYGLYDTKYDISADYDAMLRWIKDGDLRLQYIPEILVKMRVGGDSNKSLKQIIKKSREDYNIIKSNNLGGFWTLALKNLTKIRQFFLIL